MRNTATQNPANKVGRNSGAGPAGISEMRPTRAEMERGLEAVRIGDGAAWMGRLGWALGALAVVGSGVAAYAVQQRRSQRGLRGRMRRMAAAVREHARIG